MKITDLKIGDRVQCIHHFVKRGAKFGQVYTVVRVYRNSKGQVAAFVTTADGRPYYVLSRWELITSPLQEAIAEIEASLCLK